MADFELDKRIILKIIDEFIEKYNYLSKTNINSLYELITEGKLDIEQLRKEYSPSLEEELINKNKNENEEKPKENNESVENNCGYLNNNCFNKDKNIFNEFNCNYSANKEIRFSHDNENEIKLENTENFNKKRRYKNIVLRPHKIQKENLLKHNIKVNNNCDIDDSPKIINKIMTRLNFLV